ncbi:potassium/sodium hyperpolarization-activated cyclic nucleotide-gated channel 2-like [Pan troglodytes]|uniref:potassium/sodium hyperpolarization-activated cyclic nucleotide-gated channel 2-like n=1 Tax=Pan troglodytes TaxID=9598 RepID=UPI003013B33E
MAGCRTRALPRGEAAKSRRESERIAGAPALLGKPAHPPQGRPAGRSECGPPSPRPPGTRAGPRAPARSPGSLPRLSVYTSRQVEGAGSGFRQPSEGLPQCSGGLKASSSVAGVGTEAEEALRARAASTLSPLTFMGLHILKS